MLCQLEIDIVKIEKKIKDKNGKEIGTKIEEKSLIYDVTGDKRKLVNPSLTVLDIKNKAHGNIDGIGGQVLDISDLYRNAIKRVLSKWRHRRRKSCNRSYVFWSSKCREKNSYIKKGL